MDSQIHRILPAPNFVEMGTDIYGLACNLYPICRSLTGDGVRQTLSIIGRHIDVAVHEIPTGTRIFDWTVPKEWSIHAAHIKGPDGATVVDFVDCNLHVQSHSMPVHARLPLSELRKHLFSLPERPDWIPYRTTYWAETWGFCLTHRQAAALPEGIYEVMIDSALENGSLTYGEYVHRGESEDTFLCTTHICHPSLANDNCSGLALLSLLAGYLKGRRTRFTYRFLFSPGTLGPIAWLARNEALLSHIKYGLVVTGVGDAGGPTYKKSRRGDALVDRAMRHVLKHMGSQASVIDFEPYGYDERQFCSPGFNLPIGLLQRSRFGTFPEYHTSADNLDFIRPEYLAASLEIIWRVIEIAETDYKPLNLFPKGEPQLGRRGIYSQTGGDKEAPGRQMALLWVLNQADGTRSLLDIAERADLPFSAILTAARALTTAGLLKDVREDALGETPPHNGSGAMSI